jgi:DNA repair exonuclease SbcCD ATPase subunit
LIVITHDEEFVNQLGSRAHTDYYYRVGKDPATLCSKVQKVMG